MRSIPRESRPVDRSGMCGPTTLKPLIDATAFTTSSKIASNRILGADDGCILAGPSEGAEWVNGIWEAAGCRIGGELEGIKLLKKGCAHAEGLARYTGQLKGTAVTCTIHRLSYTGTHVQ